MVTSASGRQRRADERVVPTRAAITSWLIGMAMVRSSLLADLGQHDEQAHEALLARTEELVDEISLHLTVGQQQERHEALRQLGMAFHDLSQCRCLDAGDSGFRGGPRRPGILRR